MVIDIRRKIYKSATPRRIKLLLYIATILSGIFFAYTVIHHFKEQASFRQRIEEYGNTMVESSIKALNPSFDNLRKTTCTIAAKLTKGKIKKEDIPSFLEKELKDNEQLFGISVLYEPYKYSEDQKLYAPYATRRRRDVKISFVEEHYDYTERDFYKQGIKKQDPVWIDPYKGEVAGTILTEYAVPFYDPNDTEKKNPIGIVMAGYGLRRINRFLNLLPLGSTGYGFIMSETGRLATYPIEEYVEEGKSLLDIARRRNNLDLYRATKRILDSKSGHFEYQDDITGEHAHAFFGRIPASNWPFTIILVQSEILPDQQEKTAHSLIWIVTSALLFFIFLSGLLLKVYTGRRKHLWIWSGIISAFLLAAIGCLWYIQVYIAPSIVDDSIQITDRSSLSRYLSREEVSNRVDRLNNVRTGLFINYLELPGINKTHLIGTLWQRQPRQQEETDTQSIGFTFPMASELDKDVIVDRQRFRRTTSWSFNTELYQEFNYTKFPFDYKHIKIHIKPKDPSNRTLLTPDLGAYTLTNPTSLPGINPELKISSWNTLRSYFSYITEKPFAERRLLRHLGEYNIPQLYFNIILQRTFMHAFISYILPLFLALLFLFFVLRSTAIGLLKTPPEVGTILNPVSLAISIFFAVIIAHLSLRGQFSEQPIFYLEYFYIIAYIIMIMTLITIFYMVTGTSKAFIKYKNALIPQILYFPAFLSMCYIITLYVFY